MPGSVVNRSKAQLVVTSEPLGLLDKDVAFLKIGKSSQTSLLGNDDVSCLKRKNQRKSVQSAKRAAPKFMEDIDEDTASAHYPY